MSTKGLKHTEITKRKMSLSKIEHTPAEFLEAWERYETALNEDPKKLPTIGGYCIEVGISQSHILEYTARVSELEEIIERIMELQQEFCLTNGITQKVNPIFAMFLLKAKHNFKDSAITSATQINNTNISADVLADALEIMNKRK
jgi:hypothetical protein